ncbi:MAG: cyclic nucleotide-binding domain-containing protein [Cyclobacteriaceae bacterium]
MLALPESDILSSIYEDAHEIFLNKGDILTEQFAKADYFYFLLEGEISFYLNVEEGHEELQVGKTTEKYTPIGWSGLISPNRYATTVRVSSEKAKLLCWEFSSLAERLLDNKLSNELIKIICSRCTFLIREAIDLLSSFTPKVNDYQSLVSLEEFQNTRLPEEQDIVQFLRKSPFFEKFEEEQIDFLARHVERRQFRTKDIVYEQDNQIDGIYILVSGKITFTYKDNSGKIIGFRNLNTPGFMVGWTASVGAKTLMTATTLQESVLYFIPTKAIAWIMKGDPVFAREFHYRLLWLIGHQLQAIRARFISLKFNREIIAINNLIEQNSTNLDLWSPLHKVPHLLQNKLTIENAITILGNLRENGDALERNISSLCLDTISEVSKELKFYKGLVNVFQSVVKAPAELPPLGVRKICAEKFNDVFENASMIISGRENLPEEPGHIFIYNHLRNHEYNTLPNNFQITLDSHLISSEIIYKKYDDPGIRIVRIGRGGEYAHQDYYQRLGHIDVYTNESDPKTNTPEYREQKRKEFYDIAQGYLKKKINLLISPEGTSYGTEESPGPFKSGAFRLALSANPEPLIVPISIANFDKRVRKNTFSVVINKPFKVSQYIQDPNDKLAMKTFLKELQKKFGEYVSVAIDQGTEKYKSEKHGE